MNVTQANALVRELGLSPSAISAHTVQGTSGDSGVPLTVNADHIAFDREVFERIREKVPAARRPLYVEALLIAACGEERAHKVLRDASVRRAFEQLGNVDMSYDANAEAARIEAGKKASNDAWKTLKSLQRQRQDNPWWTAEGLFARVFRDPQQELRLECLATYGGHDLFKSVPKDPGRSLPAFEKYELNVDANGEVLRDFLRRRT